MSQEIDLGGTIYISSRRAAEITGYAQDYIGQLARAGHIDARRVTGLWYVQEDSLRNHKQKADEFKPTPPQRGTQSAEIETSVSFDGKDYISAARAARITGYSQDYVGQLARSEKILSRQIGNRWYVDRTGIIEHKKHNDSLLAAVQAESVGIFKGDTLENASEEAKKLDDVHYNYSNDSGDLYPILTPDKPILSDSADTKESLNNTDPQAFTVPESSESEIPPSITDTSESEEEVINQIRIRVVPEAKSARILHEEIVTSRSNGHWYSPRIAMFFGVFIVVSGTVFAGLNYASRLQRSGSEVVQGTVISSQLASVSAVTLKFTAEVAKFAQVLLSKELEYSRDI